MKQFLFERPREKLKSRGASFLSSHELFQVIIGSGSQKAGVAKIARSVAKRVQKHGSGITYQQLTGITGLGHAKICQLLALFEIANRYSLSSSVRLNTSAKLEAYVKEWMSQSGKVGIFQLSLDGGMLPVARRYLPLSMVQPGVTIGEISRQSLIDNAYTVVLVICVNKDSLQPDYDELAVFSGLSSALAAVQVRVTACFMAFEAGHLVRRVK